MRTNLGIMWRPTGAESLWFYVPGQTILEEVSKAATLFEAGAVKLPPNQGTEAAPIPLNLPKFWMSAYFAMRNLRASTYFFRVSQRVIKKWPNKTVPDGHADGFYMSDVALSGSDHVEGKMWNRENGASYREFAKFVAECMPSGNELAWSEKIVSNMRQVLKGQLDLSKMDATSFGSACPLLCSVMFLAEPGRNKRAWPLGLIMLDLVGTQYSVSTPTNPAKYYTWDRVLAHPERIDPGYKGSDPVSKPQKGPTGRSMGDYGAPIGYGALATKSDLVGVEGKLPASPRGSASTSQTIDVANDYIQMKETSLAVRWLSKKLHAAHQDDSNVEFSAWRDKDSLVGLTNLMDDKALSDMATKGPAKALGIPLTKLKEIKTNTIKEIGDLLVKRCGSFDAM